MKKIWQSKTFWANILSLVAIVVQSKTGYVIDPSIQAAALSAVNIGLRKITSEAVQ